ncbi:MAG TPA: hypothetical protein VIC33_03465 [Vicinamibacterales bacterium]
MTSKRIALVSAVVLAAALLPNPSLANEASRELRARALVLGYNLDFDGAQATYGEAIAADPNDPASYRARASSTWMHVMFDRGLVTADNYLGRFAKPPASMRTPPAEQAARFTSDLNRAMTLARAAVAAHPNDAEAHYQLGATYGLLASYSATVGDDRGAAFKAARQAYKEESRALELDPSRADAGFIVGTYRYMVASLSWPARWVAYMVGFDGGKDEGIRLIETASRYHGENADDAEMSLVLLYNREHRYADALGALTQLQRLFPHNRLLWLEAGATALRADHPADAERALDTGFAMLADDHRPRMYGEQALWLYERGAARVSLGERHEAASALHDALLAHGRAWVDDRVHTELGKLADLDGDRATARHEYEVAVKLADQDDDPVGKEEAERLLKTGYRPPTITKP